ncbi:hypothetical protein [Mycobacteroides abscessus]|uniref:hypothetical protein n=1 Tax=Mycobacteroides abscessus TaxID=36809 RepID=UPI00210620E7|nr:hypothetical protein [Mycobacteroides abscessus]
MSRLMGGKLADVIYVRYESPVPNSKGQNVGIFALANDLAYSGRLSPSDWTWWRASNDWLNTAYVDPATVDPTLFDNTTTPPVTCWFKSNAVHLLDRVPGYLALLDRYGVAWTVRRAGQPGRILYDDDVQVVVAPFL